MKKFLLVLGFVTAVSLGGAKSSFAMEESEVKQRFEAIHSITLNHDIETRLHAEPPKRIFASDDYAFLEAFFKYRNYIFQLSALVSRLHPDELTVGMNAIEEKLSKTEEELQRVRESMPFYYPSGEGGPLAAFCKE